MRFARSRKAAANPSPSPPPPPPPPPQSSSPSTPSPSPPSHRRSPASARSRSFGSHASGYSSVISRSTTVFVAADADDDYDEDDDDDDKVNDDARGAGAGAGAGGTGTEIIASPASPAAVATMTTPPPPSARGRKGLGSSGGGGGGGSSPRMPKLLVLIELSEWDRVADRARRRPREAALWAAVRKGPARAGPAAPGAAAAGIGPPDRQVHTVRCKALHHACTRLRTVRHAPSVASQPAAEAVEEDGEEADPYVAACRAILALVDAHPKAAGERESRHGCLPLHLAVFGMCSGSGSGAGAGSAGFGVGGGLLPAGARPSAVGRGSSAPVDLDASFDEALSGDLDDEPQQQQQQQQDVDDDYSADGPIRPCKSDPLSLAAESFAACLPGSGRSSGTATGSRIPARSSNRPPKMPQGGSGGHHRRGHSQDSRDFSIMGMSQMMSAEQSAGREDQATLQRIGIYNSPGPVGQQRQQYQQTVQVQRPPSLSVQDRAQSAPISRLSPNVTRVLPTSSTSARRDHYSLLVCNALLDAYPRAVKTDSEGGRLPLHIAISGQASAKVIRTLVRAYPDAARQRTKDGYLPLHLAAHWGVSSLDVVGALMKAYPDAVVGRNRWERTPLEEALVMAGENGRVNQTGLVRALRKHPNYWATAGASAELNSGLGALNLGHGGGLPANRGGGGMSDLQGLLSPGSGIEGQGTAKPSSTLVDVDASFDDDSEDYEAGAGASSGFMSRLSPRLQTGKPKPTRRSITDAQLDAARAFAAKTDLLTLVRTHSFASIPHRLLLYPDEASHLLHCTVRGGYPAKVTPLYLLCENSPPVDVVDLLISKFSDGCATRKIPGGQLPLHASCTWLASSDVVECLLKAYPSAAQQRDDLSNIPLHNACFSGANLGVVNALLEAYPRGVLVRNGQGSAPSDIVKRLRHPNRSAILLALSRCEERMTTKTKHTERTSIARPVALHQDQRQESIETMLRCGSSPQSRNSTGTRKAEQRPGSASSSPLEGGRKVADTRASPPGAEASEDDMLWL